MDHCARCLACYHRHPCICRRFHCSRHAGSSFANLQHSLASPYAFSSNARCSCTRCVYGPAAARAGHDGQCEQADGQHSSREDAVFRELSSVSPSREQHCGGSVPESKSRFDEYSDGYSRGVGSRLAVCARSTVGILQFAGYYPEQQGAVSAAGHRSSDNSHQDLWPATEACRVLHRLLRHADGSGRDRESADRYA